MVKDLGRKKGGLEVTSEALFVTLGIILSYNIPYGTCRLQLLFLLFSVVNYIQRQCKGFFFFTVRMWLGPKFSSAYIHGYNSVRCIM